MYIRTKLVLLYANLFFLHLRLVKSFSKELSSGSWADVSNPWCIMICMIGTTDEWKAKKTTQRVDSIRMFYINAIDKVGVDFSEDGNKRSSLEKKKLRDQGNGCLKIRVTQ